jgi:hypothetical protein
LRKIDFRNFELVLFDYHGKNPHQIPLRNGEYEKKELPDAVGGQSVSMGKTQYIDALNGEPQYALLDIGDVRWAGSSTNTGILQLVHLEDGHLTVVQQISYDLQAPGTGVKFNPRTGILLITGRSDDHSAHCCPENVDVVAFKWTGKSFELRTFHRVPV